MRADASRRTTAETQLRQAASVADASTPSSSEWTGDAANAARAKTHAYSAELRTLASRTAAVSAAINQYASAVERIKAAQSAVVFKQSEVQLALMAATATIGALTYQEDGDATELARARYHASTLRETVRSLDNQMVQLANERRSADAAAISGLSAPEARGNLGPLLTGSPFLNSFIGKEFKTPSLEDLSELSEVELRILFSSRESIAKEMVNSATAEEVAAWWQSNDADQRLALMLGAAPLIGSLNGVSPSARVGANVINAANRSRWLSTEIARLEQNSNSLTAFSPKNDVPALADGRDLARLKKERHYLDMAVAGKVQLYLYDPQRHSVIEMIGKPTVETERTLTYVPGTFTSDLSFFEGKIQAVARFLVKEDPATVAFVWKDGPFPGEDTPERPTEFLQIIEANDPLRTRVNSIFLKDFEIGLRSSSADLAAADHIAAGHSWGLTPITDAEMRDVQYDQVHSLAGAGMPEGWRPDDQTEYHHWTYNDALMLAQSTDMVWAGNNPWGNSAFQQHFYFSEADLVPTNSPSEISRRLLENHDLIASNNQENQRVLYQIEKEIGQ